MALEAFALTAACMECASCVVRIVYLPTMRDIDTAIYHSFQSIHLDSRMDYPCMASAFDYTSDPCSLADSDTVLTTHTT